MNFMIAFLCVLFDNLPNIFAFLAGMCVVAIIEIVSMFATISSTELSENPKEFITLKKGTIKSINRFALFAFIFLSLSLFCPSLDQIKRYQKFKRAPVEKIENIGLTKMIDALEKEEKKRDNSLR